MLWAVELNIPFSIGKELKAVMTNFPLHRDDHPLQLGTHDIFLFVLENAGKTVQHRDHPIFISQFPCKIKSFQKDFLCSKKISFRTQDDNQDWTRPVPFQIFLQGGGSAYRASSDNSSARAIFFWLYSISPKLNCARASYPNCINFDG